MTTTTSYSDKARFFALYRSAFRRSRGYFFLLSILLLIFYPFQYAIQVFRPLTDSQQMRLAQNSFSMDVYSLYGMGRQFTAVSAVFYTMLVLLAPFVLALILNRYMHSKKATDVYHALPVRREILLSVNLAVAMTIVAVPVVICNLLVLLMQTVKFGPHPFLMGQTLLDMAGWLICALFIYLLTTTVCTMTGTEFDSFTFSGILMAALPALMGLYTALATLFLLGFEPSETFLTSLLNLCPITLMPMRFAFYDLITPMGFALMNANESLLLFCSNLAMVVYLVLSVVLFFIALRLYRRRGSEIAETTTSKGILQMVIKLVGTAIGGICIGLMFYAINDERGQTAAFLMWLLIGCMISYCILEIILNRGFKTLLKSLPLGVAMIAVISASTMVLTTGGFGYENRVPDAADVESVQISYMGRFSNYDNVMALDWENKNSQKITSYSKVTLADPANIESILAFHQSVVNEKIRLQDSMSDDNQIVYTGTGVTYTLKNGKTLHRQYQVVSAEAFKKLITLETNAEFLTQTHPAFFEEPKDIIRWTVADPFGVNTLEKIFTEEESTAMLAAIKADLLNETAENLTNPSGKLLAVVSFDAKRPEESRERYSDSGYFYVTDEQQRTWKLLKDMGLTEELQPDFSKCIAVAVTDEDYNVHRYSSNSAVYQLYPMDTFSFEDLEQIRQEIKNAAEYQTKDDYVWDPEYSTYAAKYYDNRMKLVEDPALIAQMAQSVVATSEYRGENVTMRFFFEGKPDGTVVMAPLKSMPEQVQALLQSDDTPATP